MLLLLPIRARSEKEDENNNQASPPQPTTTIRATIDFEKISS
jgi:hypothetical protein